jgi:hypothetical protein
MGAQIYQMILAIKYAEHTKWLFYNYIFKF